MSISFLVPWNSWLDIPFKKFSIESYDLNQSFFEHWIKRLTGAEFKVLVFLYLRLRYFKSSYKFKPKEIADLVGLSPETVNQNLFILSRHKLVDKEEKKTFYFNNYIEDMTVLANRGRP